MTVDLNDRAKAGVLPASPHGAGVPVNAKAVEADERRPLKIFSVRELLEQSQLRSRSPLDRKGICPTGHYLIDHYTAGMRPGFTWVIAADTSVGKTSFVIAVTDETIKEKKRSLIISSEDTESLYGDRLLARRSRVSADNLRKRKLDEDEHNAIANVIRKAEDVPVLVQAGKRSIERLEKEIRAIIRGEKIDVVFWDYLQEFNSSKRHQDERLKYKYMAGVMRDVIKSENVTGAILSQLTVSENTKIPTKANIRECKDVANGAEVIVLLFKPEEDIKGSSPGRDNGGQQLQAEIKFKKGVRYALIDKNKDGPAGKKVELKWNDHSACFETVLDPEVERYAGIERETSIQWDYMGGRNSGFQRTLDQDEPGF